MVVESGVRFEDVFERKETKPELKIELGGGDCPKKGFVNLDFNGDVKHDLNKFPYPLKENSVSEIYSRHCLEHVKDFSGVVKEMFRISENNCIWDFTTPYFSSPFAFYPVHRNFFNTRSFNYVEEEGLDREVKLKVIYTRIHFYAHEKKVGNELVRLPFKFIEWVANLNQFVYERFFCWIVPAYEIRFIIKVIK